MGKNGFFEKMRRGFREPTKLEWENNQPSTQGQKIDENKEKDSSNEEPLPVFGTIYLSGLGKEQRSMKRVSGSEVRLLHSTGKLFVDIPGFSQVDSGVWVIGDRYRFIPTPKLPGRFNNLLFEVKHFDGDLINARLITNSGELLVGKVLVRL